MSRRRRPGNVRKPGDSSRLLRRERNSTLAVGCRVRAEYGRANVAGGWSEPGGSHDCARECGGEQCPADCSGKRCLRTARSGLCEEFDGYRAHLAAEMQEDNPAYVEARIAEVRDYFRVQFNEGAVSRWNSMPASTMKCLQWHCARSASRVDLR